MSFALSIYHRMPAASRSIIATARGYYLNHWRFDRQTDRLVEQALERDRWDAKRWAAHRDERLSFILERAATRVPFYREMWAERRRRGDKASWSYLENWPVLEKSDLRSHGRRFVADDCNPVRMFHEHTSGTTGTSLNLWLTKATVKQWYALFEARGRDWYGVTRKDRWAMLGGQIVVPVKRSKPPFWVWNAAMRQLYMSSYHMAPALLQHYLSALAKYRIEYIIGYPSAIYSLACEAVRSRRTDVQLRVAVTNAEPLYEHQRSTIAEAFGCPVRETYGMAEIAAAASECEHGRLHEWSDAGVIESAAAIDDDQSASDFICTGLLNADMPLIRYRVGDRGRRSALAACECGRGLPIIDHIEGRIDDVLFTTDGREVGRLDPIFKSGLPILEAQVVQHSLQKIKVNFVPDQDFDRAALTRLARLIRERMGDVKVDFEQHSEIPRTSRGKFRAVICEIPIEQRPNHANPVLQNE